MAMTLRLPEAIDRDLEALAQERGISKHQLIVEVLEAFANSQGQEQLLKEAFDLVLTRDAELLKRLADM